MNEQLLKTSGADVLSSGKNSEKPYEGVASPAPPPSLLYVRGLNCQVVEWVDIFANPVFKNPGMSIILRSVCETLPTFKGKALGTAKKKTIAWLQVNSPRKRVGTASSYNCEEFTGILNILISVNVWINMKGIEQMGD